MQQIIIYTPDNVFQGMNSTLERYDNTYIEYTESLSFMHSKFKWDKSTEVMTT